MECPGGSGAHVGGFGCLAAVTHELPALAAARGRIRMRAQVAGYSGLLLAAPTVLYEVIAYVVPGLTKSERKFLAPIVFGSSILFYLG